MSVSTEPDRPAGYRPIVAIGRTVQVLLAASGVLAAVEAFIDAELGVKVHQIAEQRLLPSELSGWFNALEGLRVPGTVLALCTGLAWLIWQHRCQANLVACGAEGLRFSPGWAVGWWFIPFANLWQPYVAMSELWSASEASRPGDAWKSGPRSRLVAWWWVAWIAGGVLGLISRFRTSSGSASLQTLSEVRWNLAAGLAMRVVAAGLAIAVVRAIVARQEALPARPRSVLPPRPDPVGEVIVEAAVEPLADDQSVLAGPDPYAALRFEQEERRLQAVMGAVAVRIAHIGPSGVPSASQVVDILLAVDNFAREPSYREPLDALGYREANDRGHRGRARFVLGDDGRPSVQVIVCQAGGAEERELLARRDP